MRRDDIRYRDYSQTCRRKWRLPWFGPEEVLVRSACGLVARNECQVISQKAAGLPAGQVMWPVRLGAVPPLASSFNSRPETGLGLAGSLAPGETTVLNPAAAGPDPDPLATAGGTGKTQLAAALAHSFWQAWTVEVLIWLTVSGRDSVVAGYAQALHDIGAAQPDAEPDAAAARFLAWLASTNRPWLIVLDDLADPADLAGLWPRGPAGHVVVTTRQDSASLQGEGRRVVQIGAFSRREALSYLTASLYDDPDQRIEALDLAEDLCCLPLALGQAAALMTDQGLDCRAYRAQFASRKRLVADPAAGIYSSTAVTTWSLSLDYADQLPPGWPGQASPRPDGAAGPEWRAGGGPHQSAGQGIHCREPSRRRGSRRAAGPWRPAEPRPARPGYHRPRDRGAHRTAASLGWCHHPGGAASGRAQAGRPGGRCGAGGNLACPGRAAHACPGAARQYVQPASLHRRPAADARIPSPAHQGRAQPGRCETHQGGHRLLADDDRLHRSRSRSRSCPGHGRPRSPGGRLWRGGQPDQAIQVRGRCLEERERTLGPEHPDTLTCRGDLAHAYLTAGRLTEAVPLYERTLAGREWALGPDHPDTLTSRGNLAFAYSSAGRLADAITFFQRTLTDRERILGPDHPDTLAARGNLAAASHADGRLKEAIPLYQRTLTDRERILGPDHPDTLASGGNLAYAYRSAGKLKDAIPLYKRTVAGRERILGPDHPDTLAARGNLAAAYHTARRLKDAIPLYERTLADRERVQGEDHPDTVTARGNLAAAYHSAGRMADAVRLYERTLADCERVRGPNHQDTLISRCNLAHAYHAARRQADAIAVFERTLADCERVLEPGHPLTQTVRESLEAATQA